jgi:DNA topoisomerase IB
VPPIAPPPQAEKAKRSARALKFGLPEEAGLAYAPDPEDAKRRQRAAKFGVAYEAPTADTLLQKAGGLLGLLAC